MPTAFSAFALALALAAAPAARGQSATGFPTEDETTRSAVQRFRSTSDPAEARRTFDELRARAPFSTQAALACGLLAGYTGSLVADRSVAMSCLRTAANAGSPEARHVLAVMLLDDAGPGGSMRRADAEKLLAEAAPTSPESVYLLGRVIAQRSPHPTIATRKVIDDAAQAGFAPAQRELAHLLEAEGARGEALSWLEKAWAQGDAEAGYGLASLLAARDREADRPRVIELLEQSAQRGSARAALALGVRLLDGDGVKRDTTKAHVLLQQAASAGLPDGQYALAYVLAEGLGIAANEALALQWFEAAAKQGHRDAMFALGNAHANGWGTGRSLNLAYRWYCRAAKEGQEAAVKLIQGSTISRECALAAAPVVHGAETSSGPTRDQATGRVR